MAIARSRRVLIGISAELNRGSMVVVIEPAAHERDSIGSDRTGIRPALVGRCVAAAHEVSTPVLEADHPGSLGDAAKELALFRRHKAPPKSDHDDDMDINNRLVSPS